MPGQISLSLDREPDYFADANLPGEKKQTVVAREGNRIVCVGSCTTRLRFVNGEPCRVGYLGGLRLDARVAGRFDILRHGYEFFRELQGNSPADFYFTSIASDNERARKFLEGNLPGIPHYEFLGEFVTLLIPVERRPPPRRDSDNQPICAGPETNTPMLAGLLNAHNYRHQLTAHWTFEQLQSLLPLGLSPDDFHLHGPSNCAALWDQRNFKQAVIRDYAPWLMWARPFLNLLARATDNPRLPAVGDTLSNAFVSHLAVSPDNRPSLLALIAGLRARAAQRGIELLTFGFVATDPRLATIHENFRCREYRSRLYLVRWPGCGGTASELDGRLLSPDVALL